MKRAFTLIEILIGIFILALALLGIAATFAATTRQVKQNTQEMQAQVLRRSADAYYPFIYRAAELQFGWNLEYIENLHVEYKILYLTYKAAYKPDTVIVIAFQGQDSAYVSNTSKYVPKNRDKIITWYGFIHEVQNDSYNIQFAELQDDFVVLPFEFMSVLDAHKRDLYDNMEAK